MREGWDDIAIRTFVGGGRQQAEPTATATEGNSWTSRFRVHTRGVRRGCRVLGRRQSALFFCQILLRLRRAAPGDHVADTVIFCRFLDTNRLHAGKPCHVWGLCSRLAWRCLTLLSRRHGIVLPSFTGMMILHRCFRRYDTASLAPFTGRALMIFRPGFALSSVVSFLNGLI